MKAKVKHMAELKNINKTMSDELNKIKDAASVLPKCNSVKLENFPNMIDLLSQKLIET